MTRNANNLNVPKDVIIQMLKRENELRLSAETQAEYKLSHQDGFTGFVRVTENLQRQVAREFGFDEDVGLKVDLKFSKIPDEF